MSSLETHDNETIVTDQQSVTLPYNTDPLWVVSEVAKYLRIKPGTVRAYAHKGKLNGIKIGRTWRFKKSMIDEFVKAQTK